MMGLMNTVRVDRQRGLNAQAWCLCIVLMASLFGCSNEDKSGELSEPSGVGRVTAAATVGADESYVVVGAHSVLIRARTRINSGNVGVSLGSEQFPTAADDCARFGDAFCFAGTRARLEVGNRVEGSTSKFVGDSIWMGNRAEVLEAYYRESLEIQNSTEVGTEIPIGAAYFPLFPQIPEPPPVQASPGSQGKGAQAVVVGWFQQQCLEPGNYGNITVRLGARLTFATDCSNPDLTAPGTYSVRNLRVDLSGRVTFGAGTYRIRDMNAGWNSRLIFQGGEHHIRNVRAERFARFVMGPGDYHSNLFITKRDVDVYFTGVTGTSIARFLVADRFVLGASNGFNANGPPGTDDDAADPLLVRVYVVGGDGPNATADSSGDAVDTVRHPPKPYAVNIGGSTKLLANIFAMGVGTSVGGTIKLGTEVIGTGAFIADYVFVGARSVLTVRNGLIGNAPGVPDYSQDDADNDGVLDGNDGCPATPDPGQEDGDGDSVGDVCDNCLTTPNPKQELAFPNDPDQIDGAACVDPLLSYCGDGVVDAANGEECDRGFAQHGQNLPCDFFCLFAAAEIIVQPADQHVDEGGTATFSVQATGRTLIYQWSVNGVDLDGATDSTLVLDAVTAGDDGSQVSVLVSNDIGFAPSDAATLHVTLLGPSITEQPTDQTVQEGSDATFSVTADGSGLTYQWERDGLPVAGATDAVLLLTGVSLADDGASFRVRVTNDSGVALSDAAILTVQSVLAVITVQPVDVQVLEGGAATFTVQATGTDLLYQWQRDGVNMPGETSPSLTITGVNFADNGAVFTCVVTNAAGSVVSSAATLTVSLGAPVITESPTDQTVNVGQSATFFVVAVGSQLTYQWRRDGVAISGETNASFTVSNVSLADNGAVFTAVVSNAAGSLTSTPATLGVSANAPVIVVQPAAQSVVEGESATFQVTATGETLSYQWLRDGVEIPGATATSYHIAAAAFQDDGVGFSVAVSNSAGSVTSQVANLAVSLATPTISAEPSSLTVNEGSAADFTVSASGSELTYQWQRDGVDIPGATSVSFSLDPTTFADDGATFRVLVSNGAGSVTSVSATLIVLAAFPVIAVQPSDQTVAEGGTATFEVVATGSALNYQWERDNTPIAGATDSVYTIAATEFADNGATFRAVVTNPGGSITSQTVVLTVEPTIATIVVQPQDVTVIEGTEATFTVQVTGSQLTYQWYRDGAAIPGATGDSYAIANVEHVDNGASFYVEVTNPAGTVTSAFATLGVTLSTPVILTQPQSIAVQEGQAASFEATAEGTLLTYQWERDGVPIAGATAPVFTLDPAVLGDDGARFVVVVRNDAAEVRSDEALLTVGLAPPVITSQPQNVTVAEGGDATFTVEATGSVLVYQWQRDGVPVAGATGSTLTLTGVEFADNGAVFTVTVSNALDHAISDASVLTVQQASPVVVVAPSDQAAPEGGSVTFTITATGSELSYQWFRDNAAIGGATESSYTLSPVALADNGSQFTVTVTNAAGSVTTDPVTLSVNLNAPSIVTQPFSLSVVEGEPAVFSVAAQGSELTYQWTRDGVDIPGATGSSYTLGASQLSDDGASFQVVVSNASAAVTSQSAVLTVQLALPVVVTSPQPVSVVEAEDATFTVAAQGSQLSYQWQRDGIDIVGATEATYTLVGAQLSDDGASFRVVVSNGAGPVTSDAATLSVGLTAPTILVQPVNLMVAEGDAAEFRVEGQGSQLVYQWQRDGVDIGGATESTFTLPAASLADNGAVFQVLVSNAAGAVSSLPATLTVNLLAPVLVAEPSAQTVTEGQPATFTVQATGSELTYQWQRDGVDIAGETGATYTLASATLADDGAVFRVTISNAAGDVTTSGAALTVGLAPPAVTTQPVDATVVEGEDATFGVVAAGSQLTYQWRRDGVDVPGAIDASYTLSPAELADNGATFLCVVSNGAGDITTATVTLIVTLGAPVIVVQPSPQTVTEGQSTTFEVVASGSQLAYQWRRDGIDIPGATASALSLIAVALLDNGAVFDVLVSNATSTITSATALLTVQLALPVITVQPANQTAGPGADVTFTVVATGSQLTYQWRRDDVDVPGATNASYTLANIDVPDNGATFTVAITNGAGTANSLAATLTVTENAPVIVTQPQAAEVFEGQTATFAIVATGTNLSYQWQRDGVDIAGATAATYVTPVTTLTDSGAVFQAFVTNTSGTVPSTPVGLLVNAAAPTITTQPQSQTVVDGDPATFSVVATGASLAYEWFRDGVLIAGANAASYTLNSATLTDQGAVFYARVFNSAGEVNSTAATLTVTLRAPEVLSQPSNQTAIEGQPANFEVTARGSSLTYQWYRDGEVIVGANEAVHALPSVTATDNLATFDVVVANSVNSVRSDLATLSVTLAAPQITQPPTAISVVEGASATFAVVASGSTVAYQWQRDGVDIPDATSASYVVPVSTFADNGASFAVVVTNTGGTVTSASAVLTVTHAAPLIVTQPLAQNVAEAEALTLTVGATGSDLSYQWFRDSAAIAGATAQTYNVASATPGDTGVYYVVVSNPGGDVQSEVAQVAVGLVSPQIRVQPVSAEAEAGTTVAFSVVAIGTDLTYQWKRFGTDIVGATGATYVLVADPSLDDSIYSVVVQNTAASLTSDEATLNITDTTPPTLEVDPPVSTSTSQGSITLTGRVSDAGVGVQTVEVRSPSLGGAVGALVDEEGEFEVTVPLVIGDNVLTVAAIDSNSNEITVELTITRALTTLPVVSIVTPQNGLSTENSQITVSGTVESSLPPGDIQLTLGSLVTFPSGSGGSYTYSFVGVPLSLGTNVLTVTAQTAQGTVSDQVVVSRTDGQPTDPGGNPPAINVQNGAPEVFVDGDDIVIGGTTSSGDTCIAQITGTADDGTGPQPIVISVTGEGAEQSFDATLMFANFTGTFITITIEVTDCLGRVSTLTYVVQQDTTAPVITVADVILGATINDVNDQPYRLRGTVTEANLSSLTINGRTIEVLPSAGDTFTFEADLELARGVERSFTIEARDLAGNSVSEALVLRLGTQLDLEILAPRSEQELIAPGATGPVTVSARVRGLSTGDIAQATLDGGASLTLTINGSLLEGTFDNVVSDADHAIQVQVRSSGGAVLAQSSVSFRLSNNESIPLELVRQEPINNATGIETNQFIALFFNRPLDVSLLEFEVRETAVGKTYATEGTDILSFSQVSLVDVSRAQEEVPGNAVNMPGNTMVAFYPGRDYAYGAEVTIDVRYDGADIVHSRFVVRPLPTLVQGFVSDQNGVPLEGVRVVIPALGREARTNAEGSFDFGWGVSVAGELPAGNHRAVINGDNGVSAYGSLQRFMNVRPQEV